jgi:hypothetical protein
MANCKGHEYCMTEILPKKALHVSSTQCNQCNGKNCKNNQRLMVISKVTIVSLSTSKHQITTG